ncbi:sodium:alanine symporter family protein [Simiduia sp. 21SJ11W-1]|uniref:alanine/glycine:cation symporter family protein n=1 Tax=Simiduia sp. 21SJ11W-1 TaxID=2909669 RepID=UPI00209FAD58|nr:sodium:alanine symporter family protein [Simiduia sp. 21SJ11W-1]UTA49652.1 sodium:alanine symporter family protein [Simiduia sp. 21SJ11W-1]
MLALLLGTGLYMMTRLKALPLRKVGYGFSQLFKPKADSQEGDITPFNALMTALAATIGTGNIVGVATAIGLGGPGALFWMWCSALLGMATKFSEATLAVHFREVDAEGKRVGGPMYYIKNGLGKRWAWLGVLFAFFGSLAAFGIGNTVQVNSIASAVQESTGVAPIITGGVLFVLVFAVLAGGIKRIGEVAGKLVPFMAVTYIVAGVFVLIYHIDAIPAAFALIVESAFNPQAAMGGAVGVTLMMTIQFGVARGVFSNEAGLGSAPIAHAAAQTNSPVRQGVIAMLGTFIDTIVVCSITGLAIVASGAWQGDAEGAGMSIAAFSSAIPGGQWVITVGLVLFAFTTVLGWSYYGERCAQFLFGERSVWPYRLLFIAAVPVGATMQLDFVWLLADTLNGMMAIPNLIAVLALSGVVIKLARDYFNDPANN